MRKDLGDHIDLVCPACSWTEEAASRLDLEIKREVDGDVVSGRFTCAACGRRFPIIDGVAVLDPEPLRSTYDRPDSLQAYLWTHYARLNESLLEGLARDRGDYFTKIAAQPAAGLALDVGCNVGRSTFDMSAKADFVLGIERSFEAVKRAREIARTGRVAFHMKDEGDRGRYVDLDASSLVRPNVEFVCGDAISLPLAPGVADTILAANLVDRVRHPKLFLARADRILRPGGLMLLTAPFSWNERTTPRERWIGDAQHSAREVIEALAADTGYVIEETDELTLTIRNHRRSFELIRPLFMRCRKES